MANLKTLIIKTTVMKQILITLTFICAILSGFSQTFSISPVSVNAPPVFTIVPVFTDPGSIYSLYVPRTSTSHTYQVAESSKQFAAYHQQNLQAMNASFQSILPMNGSGNAKTEEVSQKEFARSFDEFMEKNSSDYYRKRIDKKY